MTSQEEADLALAEHREARRRGEAIMRYANDNGEQNSRLSTMFCISVFILVMVWLIASMLAQ